MLRTIGKTVGTAIAVLCLAAALAGATERVCTASDGKGNCTAAIGTDGKVVLVVGEGVKVGERVACVDRSNVISCTALATK